MQLLQALRAAPRAIQRRGDKIYAVAHRPSTPGSAACYTVKRYPATVVNPPDGVKAADWIANGFKK